MNAYKKLLLITVIYNIISITPVHAMNLLSPFDTLLRPPYERHLRFHTNFFIETGFQTKNFNNDGSVNSPLHIWQTEQNSLAMLEGFDPSSTIGSLRNQLNANDDTVRGHFAVCGDLDSKLAAAVNTRFFFLHDWFVSLHLPFYHIQLDNITFADKTENNNDADFRVKNLLTNDFIANVKQLGCLNITNWKKTGLGDFTLLLNWYRDFPQAKEVLKNARINWRVGVTLPTGKQSDIDTIFSIPFGHDGACALPFGAGLDLTFGNYFQAGLDVQLTHIFGHTRECRIKTAVNQTELLLLQKERAYKDYGLTQRFNLYAKMDKFIGGLSVLVGYQFLKHGQDHLALHSYKFSNAIANTAESLKEFTIHHFIINTSYDFAVHTWHKKQVLPYLSVYTRIPFNGKRFTGNSTIGCVFALDF